MLTTHTDAPEVTETTMGADFLQALQIVTELRVDTVGKDLVVFAVHNILLPVQEPCWDFVLGGVLDDGDDTLELIGVELTSSVWGVRCQVHTLKDMDAPLVEVNIGLLADQVGVPSSNTLDLGQGVHDLALSINVGVEQTQNVL